MTLTDEQRRIRRMRKSYNDARKQVKKAMAECSAGTNTHLAHIKALAEIDANERAEEIALGLSPANLGAVTRTEFLYVAFANSVPTTREELAKVLGTQLAKACEGLAISDEDAATRQKLEEDYPNAK